MLGLAAVEIVVVSTAGCTLLASCLYFLSGEDPVEASSDEGQESADYEESKATGKIQKQIEELEKAENNAGTADRVLKGGFVVALVSGFAGVKPLVDVVTGEAPSWGLPIVIGIGVMFLGGILMIVMAKRTLDQTREEVAAQAEQALLEEEMGLDFDDENPDDDEELEINLEPDGNVEVEEIEIDDLPELGAIADDDQPKKKKS